jgi:lipid-binding SYLF domain-containing protein
MTTIRRGIVLAVLGLLAPAAGARGDSPGDVSLTAGPKSLHDAANTDGTFKAEIFSYARSTGLFAGASFEGATVQPDGSAIRTLYRAKADSRDVLLNGRYAVPASARPFVNVLTTYSPPPKKR